MLRYLVPSLVLALAVGYAAVYHFEDKPADEVYHPQLAQLSDPDGAVERMATALTFPAIADVRVEGHVSNPEPFEQLHEFFEKSYPLVYSNLELELVANYSMLFHWRGSDPTLRPMLLMAHQDVVPAPDNDPSNRWKYGPFSGTVIDGEIWGRGAQDIKISLIQQLEAVSQLLAEGFKPKRGLYLAYGHDEEIGGGAGAHSIAALLKSRGVELELVIDEGGAVLVDGLGSGAAKLVKGPVGLVGTSEKGFQTWEIEVTGNGGHSSWPPTDGSSVATRLSKVLATIEATPTTATLVPPVTDWAKALAPAVSLGGPPLRWALANADSPLVKPVLAAAITKAGRELAGWVRTTAAVVGVVASGGADNTMPTSGTIIINFRLLPGHGTATIEEWLRLVTHSHKAYATFKPRRQQSRSALVSSATGPQFRLIKQVIFETMSPPEGLAVVVPYLVGGTTDSSHYQDIAPGRVFRFAPQFQNRTGGTLERIHGVNERVAITEYHRGIQFFMRLIKLGAGDKSFA